MNATTANAANAYAYPLLVKQLWHAPLRATPDQEIVHLDRRVSYRELRARVGRLASTLEALGVRAGDTVGVIDWDSLAYLESFYAVPMMGAVLLTVNVRLAPEQILYTINHAAASLLLVNAEFLPLLESIQDRLESVRHVIVLGAADERTAAIRNVRGRYEDLLALGSPAFAFQDFDENARATTFYTTGTTGQPKGVYFTHRQLVIHTLAGMAAFASPASGQRFHRGDVYMPLTPMFHVHAWGMPYIALQLGVKQVYPDRFDAPRALELIAREGVTFGHCVPTVLQMLLDAPGSAAVDLSRLKLVIGGSALPSGCARAARARGIDAFVGYGMSETCPLLTLAQLQPGLDDGDDDARARWLGKAGVPLPLVDLRIVDEQVRDVDESVASSGEIVARTPWLTQGYLGRPEASDALWRGGYLHTQDVGYFDRGYLTICDRIRDVIKSGGEWISTVQLEDLISLHAAVGECAVIGVADDKWGERPLAFVVAKSGATLDVGAIRAMLLEHAESGAISRFAVPREILIVTALPKTSVGKIDKKRLRAEYGRDPIAGRTDERCGAERASAR